jgi:hypothetical protein
MMRIKRMPVAARIGLGFVLVILIDSWLLPSRNDPWPDQYVLEYFETGDPDAMMVAILVSLSVSVSIGVVCGSPLSCLLSGMLCLVGVFTTREEVPMMGDEFNDTLTALIRPMSRWDREYRSARVLFHHDQLTSHSWLGFALEQGNINPNMVCIRTTRLLNAAAGLGNSAFVRPPSSVTGCGIRRFLQSYQSCCWRTVRG